MKIRRPMDNASADSKDEDDIAELERKIRYVFVSCVQYN